MARRRNIISFCLIFQHNSCPTCRCEIETDDSEYNELHRDRIRRVEVAAPKCVFGDCGRSSCVSAASDRFQNFAGCGCHYHEDCLKSFCVRITRQSLQTCPFCAQRRSRTVVRRESPPAEARERKRRRVSHSESFDFEAMHSADLLTSESLARVSINALTHGLDPQQSAEASASRLCPNIPRGDCSDANCQFRHGSVLLTLRANSTALRHGALDTNAGTSGSNWIAFWINACRQLDACMYDIAALFFIQYNSFERVMHCPVYS